MTLIGTMVLYSHCASGNRFSLLLLEDEEFYITECVTECRVPSGFIERKGELALGQLRLCTKSVFFEPDDVRIPIVRIPYRHVEALEGNLSNEVEMSTRSYTTMKPDGRDAPYVFHKNSGLSTWFFRLTYAPIGDVLPYAHQMLAISRLDHRESAEMAEMFLENMEQEQRFDIGCLVDPACEKILMEKKAMLVSRLIKERGIFVVTDARVYFQPLHNISGGDRVKSHPISEIVTYAKRRSGLKDVGVEIFFSSVPKRKKIQTWKSDTALIVFKTKQERELVLSSLTEQMEACCVGRELFETGPSLERACVAWQRGLISNFEYLLYVNFTAGRSFEDLTQYPVFPWVVSDFEHEELHLRDPSTFRDLRKPIGALNQKRLEFFKSRYSEMESMREIGGDEPFLFGTHYSCPGYTLFWLVRSMPAHMLRLQNGKFDAPDRSFTGIQDAWNSVFNSPTDLKELIPEFYCPNSGEFLKNSKGLALGCRQNGKPVGDVELPPWAHSSPRTFLEKHREALESPFVSANLHHWIDLIFGVHQRGESALQHDNVFRHITYEGMTDIDTIADPIEKKGVEVAIAEFGQCPRQIFRQQHPQRLVSGPCGLGPGGFTTLDQESTIISKFVKLVFDMDIESAFTPSKAEVMLLDALALEPLHQNNPLKPPLSSQNNGAGINDSHVNEIDNARSNPGWSTVNDMKRSMLTEGSKKTESLLRYGSNNFQPRQLVAKISAGLQSMSPRKQKFNHSYPASEPANTATDENNAHQEEIFGSGISAVRFSPKNDSQIAVSFEDGHVRIIDIGSKATMKDLQVSEGQITSVAWVGSDLLAGGYEGQIYSISSESEMIRSFTAHEDIVSSIDSIENKYLASASWDCTIKVFDLEQGIHRGEGNAQHQTLESPSGALWSMKLLSRNIILSGTEEGAVLLHDIRSTGDCSICNVCDDFIGGLAAASDNQTVAVASADGILRFLDLRKMDHEFSMKSFDSPLLCCSSGHSSVFVGTESGQVYECPWPSNVTSKTSSLVPYIPANSSSVTSLDIPISREDCIVIGRENGSLLFCN